MTEKTYGYIFLSIYVYVCVYVFVYNWI